MSIANYEQIAASLSESPDYKVLRRLIPRTTFKHSLQGTLAKGIAIDTETTSLNPETGKIIEIGLVSFEYDALSCMPLRVLETYGALEDPGHPLSIETTDITGISDEMVNGQRIDDNVVKRMVADAQLVVAHNSSFDRPFLENRLPIFADLPWGCSLTDIDWKFENLGSRKLDYIAFKLGFFFDAHRAMEDSQALLEILTLPLPVSGKPGLKQVIDRVKQSEYAIFAMNSPYSTKDILKARQYRWDANKKTWYRSVSGLKIFEEELRWLKEVVYGGKAATIEVQERSAKLRFSLTQALTKTITL